MKTLAASLGEQPVTLCAFDGKQGRLLTTRALAPGQPLTLTVQEGALGTLDLKSLGSVRQPDGRFEVRVRAVSLPRALRERLVAHFRED